MSTRLQSSEHNVPTMVENILAVYDAATVEHAMAGVTWYSTASNIVDSLASWSGCEAERVAAAMAALSPRNPWLWNVQDTAAFAWAATHGEPMPIATTFGRNRRQAWAFLTGWSDWSTSALKVRSFVANIRGDMMAVTVDVWAVRIATAGARDAVRGAADYAAIAQAYVAAAALRGCAPIAMQATTWIVAQSRSGHAMTRRLKRGTLPIVADMMTGQKALGL